MRPRSLSPARPTAPTVSASVSSFRSRPIPAYFIFQKRLKPHCKDAPRSEARTAKLFVVVLLTFTLSAQFPYQGYDGADPLASQMKRTCTFTFNRKNSLEIRDGDSPAKNSLLSFSLYPYRERQLRVKRRGELLQIADVIR